MSGALRGIAHGGAGAVRGFMGAYQFMQAMQDRKRALEGERLFGDTLRTMYGPQPGEATGAPQNLLPPGGVQGGPPGGNPPMQVPGMQPMPGAMPGPQGMTQPMPQGPGMPMPLSARPPMPPPGGPPMGGPPGMPPPPAPQDFGSGAPSGAPLPNAPEGAMQRPAPQLEWKSVLTTLARQNPNADPATLGRVVDRLLPMMNSQSQMEWREISGRIKALEQERKTSQGDRRLDQGDRRLDQGDAANKERRRMNDARINKINTSIDTAATQAKLPPETKAILDTYKTFYNRMSTALNVAQTNLQRAMFEGSEENKVAAQQDVKEAEEALRDAQTRLESYVAKLLPTAKLDFTGEQTPAKPGKTSGTGYGQIEQLATGEQVVPLKSGGKAQVGAGSAPAIKPGDMAPTRMEKPIANTTPKVTAKPSPSASTQAQSFPLPKSKAMMVKGRQYGPIKGAMYTWDGAQLVKVKNGGAK